MRTGEAVYVTLYSFWSKLFALAVGIGVVTGLVLSYEFGTNWSRFSAAAGNVPAPFRRQHCPKCLGRRESSSGVDLQSDSIALGSTAAQCTIVLSSVRY